MVMKNSILSVLIASLVIGVNSGGVRADDKTTRERFDDRAHQVNATARKPGMMPIALQGVSTETGLPLERVESMHKRYADAGAAGVLIACVLADETKKDPEIFLKKRIDGKTWEAIAAEQRVPITKLKDRLDRFERVLVREEGRDKRR
ncbi:MAG: hypothetical protein QOJ40_1974 [Verrucomicrobiota bacterium]|jgi:hypothetical protein